MAKPHVALSHSPSLRAPSLADRTHDRGASRWANRWVFLRHQTASAAATGVDFAIMIVLVEGAKTAPTVATAFGAAGGAVTNFLINRRWTFSAVGPSAWGQSLRYALVSASSLLWNVLGVHLLRDVLGMPYVAARAVVSLSVGVLWNFPLHRRFVFPTVEA